MRGVPTGTTGIAPNPDAERGRGLALVEAFSNRWGWHQTTMNGLLKVVWAEWTDQITRASQSEATWI
jgi:hypothetical protein